MKNTRVTAEDVIRLYLQLHVPTGTGKSLQSQTLKSIDYVVHRPL